MENKTSIRIIDSLQNIKTYLKSYENSSHNAPPKDVKSRLRNLQTLCEQHLTEPLCIRSIHHMACTGGTLITKCIASMNNVVVLNEIDPLSKMTVAEDRTKFRPTDIVSALHMGHDNVDTETLVDIFVGEMSALIASHQNQGVDLVVRDHSHSHFMFGKYDKTRPSVGEILDMSFDTRSIVTIRNPIDSFLSLQKNGWHTQLEPATFKEYCLRYIAFMERYASAKIIKYEDFVLHTDQVMQDICGALDLKFEPDFKDLFSAFQFSGDSGRSSETISSRLGMSQHPELRDQVKALKAEPNLQMLNTILRYRL